MAKDKEKKTKKADEEVKETKEKKEEKKAEPSNEEKLQAAMTDEQKELFSRYTDAVREVSDLAECLLFQNSFKLGARMMLEVMEE